MGKFSTLEKACMRSYIQLTSPVNSFAEKPWIKDLLDLSLDKKAFKAYIQALVAKCLDSHAQLLRVAPGGTQSQTHQILHETFIELFVPFSDEEVIDFNPSDDLLYRLKLLNETCETQYSRTLYSEILHYRAAAILRQDEATKALLNKTHVPLTRKLITDDPDLYRKYHEISYQIDDVFALLVVINKHNIFYRCEISQKITAQFVEFEKHQDGLVSVYVFLKLGELLRAEFPHALAVEVNKKLRVFTTDLPQLMITQFYSFELSKEVSDELVLQAEYSQNDALWSIYFGKDVLFNYLQQDYRKPKPKTRKRANDLQCLAADYIECDLLRHTPLRAKLDSAINEIMVYGREKALIPGARFKSEAAFELSQKLKSLADDYFSNPDKSDGLRENFHHDCLAAVQSSHLVLREHRTPRWQRIIGNVLLAVSAVVTLGLTLVAKRYYSKMTTGMPTFFKDSTRGVGKTRAVIALIENDKAELEIEDADNENQSPNDISMTRVSRSRSG
jgi:hypothetical protein